MNTIVLDKQTVTEKINTSNKRANYEDFIKNHTNYDFIPDNLKQNWVSVSKNGINPRKNYWVNKLQELIKDGYLPTESTLTNLAKYIHPTKNHVCKSCGLEHSIFYVYPTENTWKWLNKNFNVNKNDVNKSYTIFQLFENIEITRKHNDFIKYFDKPMDELKYDCYNDKYNGKKLSPGVMGNPPDRLDGFHCYNNICGCRPTKDKGRHPDNMKKYTRDRRAYEMISDGNVLLANALMGKLNTVKHKCFMCNKEETMTADHIGPISLGFIHDPNNFQACCSKCNSSKNNRFTQTDINKIKLKEEQGISMISWWAEFCWNKCKRLHDNPEIIQNILNNNAKKMLHIIEWFKNNKVDVLKDFIQEEYINHKHSYKIDSINILDNGYIEYKVTSVISEKNTKTKQKDRTIEVCLENNNKQNRKIKAELNHDEVNMLIECNNTNFKEIICKVLENEYSNV